MSDKRPPAVRGSIIANAMLQCGIDSITTVPDFVQIATHQYIDQRKDQFLVTYCSDENQALHVATGLYIGGKNPAVMMQNQGLYNCMNSLRACGLDASIPLFLMIGQFGREFSNIGKDSRQSRRRMVSLLEPTLATFGIPYWNLDGEGDLGVIETAWKQAQRDLAPVAVIVGNHTEWD